jgi:hypothetical protein
VDKKEIPRWHMSYQEYLAYQELCALVGTIGNLSKKLEKRLRAVPGGWRDARMLDAVSASLVARAVLITTEASARSVTTTRNKT